MFGQLPAPVPVYGFVHGKSVIALFKQEGIAGIGTFPGIGGLVLPVHEHARMGKILGTIQAFGVYICEKISFLFNFVVEIIKGVSVKQLCAVGYIG